LHTEQHQRTRDVDHGYSKPAHAKALHFFASIDPFGDVWKVN